MCASRSVNWPCCGMGDGHRAGHPRRACTTHAASGIARGSGPAAHLALRQMERAPGPPGKWEPTDHRYRSACVLSRAGQEAGHSSWQQAVYARTRAATLRTHAQARVAARRRCQLCDSSNQVTVRRPCPRQPHRAATIARAEDRAAPARPIGCDVHSPASPSPAASISSIICTGTMYSPISCARWRGQGRVVACP